MTKAWRDSQQTNCWFLELECGHVVFRPLQETWLPATKAVCEFCLECSEPEHNIPESIK